MVDLSKRANPFEAPQNDGGALGAQSTPGVLDPVLAMRQGFEGTMRNIGPWLAMLIAGTIIAMIVSFTVIGIFVVLPVMFWGGTKFLLNVVDGEGTFGDLFSGFSRYGEALGGMIGYVILAIVVGLPGSAISYANTAMEMSGGGSTVLALLGFLVSVVWFFAVSMRFVFAPFYMVDQGQGPIEGMTSSWRATKLNLMPTALFFVLMILVVIAGMIALLIGVIPATMIAYTGLGAAYRQISGTSRR